LILKKDEEPWSMNETYREKDYPFPRLHYDNETERRGWWWHLAILIKP